MKNFINLLSIPIKLVDFNTIPVELEQTLSALLDYLEERIKTKIKDIYLNSKDVTFIEKLLSVLDNFSTSLGIREPYLESLKK